MTVPTADAKLPGIAVQDTAPYRQFHAEHSRSLPCSP